MLNCKRLPLSGAFMLAIALSPLPAIAQIAGDGTLGTQVNGDLTAPCVGACFITNGSVRGGNLFHSLQQFSLPNATDLAGFVITPGTQNVIVRVTGQGSNFVSNLNGTVGTITPTGALTPANFFLLNPNGIVFGPNASLLVGGSFLATTAERMQFRDGTSFSTRDPAPLLTISVPIGLQAGPNPGKIESAMQAVAGQTGLFTDIALVGGEVVLDGSTIVSPGARVSIGGLAAGGSVGLDDTNGLSLNFPNGVSRSNVSLQNGSVIDVSAAPGGTIALTGQNIDINGSLLLSGVNGDADTALAGDIALNAIDQVVLEGTSSRIPNTAIINAVLPGSTGNSGNIQITAGSMEMKDRATILANTTGTGNAGNVLIQVRDRVSLNNASTIESNVTQTGVGQGGNIQIDANAISLNGSQIQTLTAGQGNSGNVVLVAQDQVILAGRTTDGTPSGVITGVNPTGVGSGGTLQISAGELTLTDDAQLRSASLGRGNAGDIVIDVRDRVVFNAGQALSVVTNTGVGNAGQIRITANVLELLTFESALQSTTAGPGNAGNIVLKVGDRATLDASSVITTVDRDALGQGGDIQISTKTLEMRNRGQLNTTTFGTGNAGNILVNAGDRILLNSADIVSGVQVGAVGNGGNLQIFTNSLAATNQTALNTSSIGAGSAGAILIQARDLAFDDSFIASRALEGSTGNSNDITISANRITLTNGARFLATTNTEGNAGNIRIGTESLTIAGINSQTQEPSAIISATLGAGKGGNIVVNASTVRLVDGVLIDVRTIASGDSGTITVNSNTVDVLNGSQIGASTEGSGRAGAITVNARNQVNIQGIDSTYNSTRFTASPNSGIVVRSLASGGAGDIEITTPRLQLNQGVLNAQSAAVDGGNITLNVRDILLLRNGSLISATAGTAQAGGNGGNITINAPKGFIVGVKAENSDITANAFTGSGGRVNITAEGIYGLQFRPRLTPFSDITASSTFGSSGIVTLNTPNVDPSRGLQELPVNLANSSQQIVQTCPRGGGSRELGTFVVTGRGGVPQSPSDLRSGSLSGKPLASLNESASPTALDQSPIATVTSAKPASAETYLAGTYPATPTQPIVEAQRIVRTAEGEIYLVAITSDPIVLRSSPISTCPPPAP